MKETVSVIRAERIFCYIILQIITFQLTLIHASDKSSQEIQIEINSENKKVQKLKNDINKIDNKIRQNIKDEKKNAQIIVELEMQMSLTEKLIRALSTEELLIKRSIKKIDSEIASKEKTYNDLRNQLSDRAIYIYKNNNKQSNLENLIISGNWNESMYKMKYLTNINKHERLIRDSIKVIISDLNSSKNKKNKTLRRKKELKLDKIAENRRLTKSKKTRDKILGNLKSDSIKLKKEMNSKESMIAEIESTIKKLYEDKEKTKKIEIELAKIRAKKNITTAGSFKSMMGKLSWPVSGKIVSSYGNKRNTDTKTITFNPYIEIQTHLNSKVTAVLDGIVRKISYIPKFGSIIILDHGDGYSTVYSNLDNIVVNEDDYIQLGQNIANVSTNNNRLQFQIYYNGESSNPEKWLRKK